MKNELTPTMKRAIAYMLRHGGKVVRYPGGYWASETWKWAGESHKTSTIEALVRRGVAEYTVWKESSRGNKFPIECKLKDNPA